MLVRINAVNGVIHDTEEHISLQGLKNIRGKLFPKGTLLFAMYGSIGKVAICGRELSTNQAILGILPKREDEIDLGYLKTWFASNKQRLINQGRGVALKNLSATIIRGLEIELPSFEDQIRIAHLLGKVEGLIAQRKQHQQQLDHLLKSVFVEMFGDPVRNEKGWDKREIGKCISIKHGFAFKSEYFSDEGPYVLLTPGNFYEKGGFRDRGSKQKYYIGETPKEYILNKGALLFAMTEQAPGLLGSPLIVPESDLYLHNQRLGLAVAKEPIQAQFLFHLFNQNPIRQIIHAKATGTKVRHTSPTKLENIIVGYPPIELQNQFANIVEKIETLKSRYQQSLNDLESLYGGISQKAFKGELDLSLVPLPDSKNLTREVAEISVDSTQTQKSGEQVINKLNKFNSQHAVFLDALNSMPALKIANSPIFKAARELSEQAALWRTPLDQFKNMNSVARATAAIATASNIAGVNSAALLAQQIASAIPKMDMAWLKDQQTIINAAVGPFSEMRQAIAALQLPDPEGRLTNSESAVSAIQAAVSPDNAFPLALAIQQDDNENEPRYIFTRDDILQVLSGEQPLSVIDLMSKLAELEVITPEGYSRIKTLLFS